MWECVACDIGCFFTQKTMCAAVAHSRRIRARSVLRASLLGWVSDCANGHLMHPSRVPVLATSRARSCRSYTASMKVHAADGLTGKALAFLTANRCLDLRHSRGTEKLSNGGVPIPLRLRSHPRQSGKKQH